MAKGAIKVRKDTDGVVKYAAVFHCEVEDLVDAETVTEEMKQEPKWCFVFFNTRMI